MGKNQMYMVGERGDLRVCSIEFNLVLILTRNIFKKDIQRHSKEDIHLKSCCNWKLFFMHNRLVLDVD